MQIINSVCPHDCPSTCALEVERLDGVSIGRIRGAADNPYTAGVICAKVARYSERIHHPDRLRTPLRRIKEKGLGLDSFIAISWEEALDKVAEQLILAEQKYGSESVWPYFYAGTMGLVQRDGIERLRHVKKYSRQHSTFCIALSDAGWKAGTGTKRGLNPLEMAFADLIVIWGTNPVNTQVNVMTHITRARKERGAKIVVVDPYCNASAKQADVHLMLNPGTDGALACAVMHVLFKEGYADKNYMARYTDVPERLEQHLKDKTPAWASKITGLLEEEIISFARMYGESQKSFIRCGYGFTRSRNGAAQMHAVSCLPAVTGAWQYYGGGALYSNADIYNIDSTLIMGLDKLDEGIRILDQSRIGEILNGNVDDLGDGPPVKALFVQNTNPMNVAPDLLKVREGMQRNDLFICVHEQFLTETAEMADIVLPATTFLEHDDMYTGGGHTYFQVAKQIVEPIGLSKSNHWVHCELAKRLGAEHPGFQMSAWEIMDATLKTSGYPDAETIYKNRWFNRDLPFEKAHFLNGFEHADGKFHFDAKWSDLGSQHEVMNGMPDHFDVIDITSADYPYRLVTAPSRNYLNTTFAETRSSVKKEGRPVAKIHPSVCKDMDLIDGDLIRIGSKLSSIVIHVNSFQGVQPNTIIIEGIWPNKSFIEGIGVNSLVSSEPGRPNGGAVYHDTSVWVRKYKTN